VSVTQRKRLSAMVDAELLAAGQHAVAEGRARSLSAWVNDALARQVHDARHQHEQRMKALGTFIREYEAEHGVITDEEIREAERYFRARTIRIGPRRRLAGADHSRSRRGRISTSRST
jgi:hypothetical protein